MHTLDRNAMKAPRYALNKLPLHQPLHPFRDLSKASFTSFHPTASAAQVPALRVQAAECYLTLRRNSASALLLVDMLLVQVGRLAVRVLDEMSSCTMGIVWSGRLVV